MKKTWQSMKKWLFSIKMWSTIWQICRLSRCTRRMAPSITRSSRLVRRFLSFTARLVSQLWGKLRTWRWMQKNIRVASLSNHWSLWEGLITLSSMRNKKKSMSRTTLEFTSSTIVSYKTCREWRKSLSRSALITSTSQRSFKTSTLRNLTLGRTGFKVFLICCSANLLSNSKRSS